LAPIFHSEMTFLNPILQYTITSVLHSAFI
jgi:hypothetical protein